MRILVLCCLLLATSPLFAAKSQFDGSHVQSGNLYPRVKMLTSMGDIVVELDRARAPITVNNFLRYVDKKSYDNTLFHRIVEDFVVQGGGYEPDYKERPRFPPIYNESGNGLKNQMYSIAMAREAKPHSANRQFYFNMNDNESLDPGRNWGYAVFGSVVEGYEVLDAMALAETHYHAIFGWADVPKQPIILKTIELLPENFTTADTPPEAATGNNH